MGWFLEELEPISLISHKQKNYVSLEYSLPHNEFTSPNKQHVENIERSPSPKLMVKKLNHNASERDRRKKVNSLISSLRSLLPGEDQTVLILLIHPLLIYRCIYYYLFYFCFHHQFNPVQGSILISNYLSIYVFRFHFVWDAIMILARLRVYEQYFIMLGSSLLTDVIRITIPKIISI
jgi:hypothetical protein